MARHDLLGTLTDTSPSSVTTAAGAGSLASAEAYDALLVTAAIRGGTGGTLDVYLQHSFDGATWFDLVHWPQLAAAAALVNYACLISRDGTPPAAPNAVGINLVPALAANTIAQGGWGPLLRLVYKTGASNTAGGVQTVVVYGIQRHF